MLKKSVITLILLILFSLPALSVTKEEMEQAKAITALWYLRYINDGSDYLEKLSPKTLSELEKSLKKTEKENIKSFKAIAVPADYSAWDKQKLVDYWSKTFFTNSGIPSKAHAAKKRIRNRLNNMTVASATAPADDVAQPAENKVADPAETPQPEPQTPAETAPTAAETMPEPIADINSVAAESENSADDVAAETDAEPLKKSSKNSSTTYIIILVVLVAIVVMLIVYSINSMKKSRREIESARSNPSDDADALISKKNMEIAALQEEVEQLKAELRKARAEARSAATSSSAPAATQYVSRPTPQRQPRTIFLARVNAKGIFVRAESRFNPEHSLFKLVTSDGVSGSFSVIDNETVVQTILSRPEICLANACSSADDLQQTDGVNNVITESAGTAIFEEGRWVVTRKAEIRYE